MTIVEIVVDKLPEGCADCRFCVANQCSALKKDFCPSYTYPENFRRHDCPLAESVVSAND